MRATKHFIITLAILFTFSFGVYLGAYQGFPFQQIQNAQNLLRLYAQLSYTFDDFGRLVSVEGKEVVQCPQKTSKTGVILAIGQSNSANSGRHRFKTKYQARVFNLFDGKCYNAQSPLLGASGGQGEFMTPLADKLIESNIYDQIIIIASGISGTPISRWAKNGDLNAMLIQTLKPLIKQYPITDIVWHQGERDYQIYTHTDTYNSKFLSMYQSLKNIGVSAPIHIAIATKCFYKSGDNNPVADAQKMLIKDYDDIFLGANTDEIVRSKDRFDGCHFNKNGQEITANAFAEKIIELKKSRASDLEK